MSDADATRKIWYYISGKRNVSSVFVSPNETIDDLKKKIYNTSPKSFARCDAPDIILIKVNVDFDRIMGAITAGKYHLETKPEDRLWDIHKISQVWPQPPSDDPIQLHVYVAAPTPVDTTAPQDGSPLNRGHLFSYAWLAEVHSKTWKKKEELERVLFREVEVTEAHFIKLQELLVDQYPDRNEPEYDGNDHNVESIKLDVLIPSRHPDNIHPEASNARMDVDSPEASDKDRYGVDSPLPFTLKFLDMTPLRLEHVTPRMPSPLFVRQEYDDITALIEHGPKFVNKSVIVSGQPGTGKTAYLYLRVIQSMIEGRPFLFQDREQTIYHINEDGVQAIGSCPSDNIVAFVDGDRKAPSPHTMLWQNNVRVILAASPNGTDTYWVRQNLGNITIIATTLWSDLELFIAGVFLYPFDISLRRLWESASYFGYNPRLCFPSACSVDTLETTKSIVMSRITSVGYKETNMLQMLNASRTGDKAVSHSIFQISPRKDGSRLLTDCEFTLVSQWAFKHFSGVYERHDAHAVDTFYRQISTLSLSASLWGHIFEAKVLHYIDTRGCDFEIRGLTSLEMESWECPGPIPRFNFLQESDFVDALTKAIQEEKDSLHLVPSARNFTAVDSILYTRNNVLTFIQCTVAEEHLIRLKGLASLRSWLKTGTPLEPLRPSNRRPWRFIFVVPPGQSSAFKPQRLDNEKKIFDESKWAGWIQQYVLGLNVLETKQNNV